MTVSVNKKFDNVSDGVQNMIAAATHDYTKSNFNENMNKKSDQQIYAACNNKNFYRSISRRYNKFCDTC